MHFSAVFHGRLDYSYPIIMASAEDPNPNNVLRGMTLQYANSPKEKTHLQTIEGFLQDISKCPCHHKFNDTCLVKFEPRSPIWTQKHRENIKNLFVLYKDLFNFDVNNLHNMSGLIRDDDSDSDDE